VKIRGRLPIAASFAVAILWAAPAGAQAVSGLSAAQRLEMYCVQDALAGSDDAYDLTDVYLAASTADDETLEAAYAVLKKYLDVCAAKHRWGAEKSRLAETIGLHGAIVDVLVEDLSFDGAEDEDIEKIFAETRKLPAGDIDKIRSSAWRTDDVVRERIAMRFSAAGLPDDDYFVESALELMEAAIAESTSVAQWSSLVKK